MLEPIARLCGAWIFALSVAACAAPELPPAEDIPIGPESHLGQKAKPDEGGAFGIVFGSLGSAGNDRHVISRRIVLTREGENAYAVWGGGAQAMFATGLFGGIVHSRPHVSYRLEGIGASAKAATFAFRLKPGVYQLLGLDAETQSHRTPWSVRPSDQSRSARTFTVAAGEAIYLGEHLTAVGHAQGTDRPPIVYSLVSDMLERDAAILRRRGFDIPVRGVESLVLRLHGANEPTFQRMVLPFGGGS